MVIKTIGTQDTFSRWRQALHHGKEHWNEWVDKLADCRLEFKGVNFVVEALEGEGGIKQVDFSGLKFPVGGVVFKDCRFVGTHVDFSHSEFSGGRIVLGDRHENVTFSFHCARFNETEFEIPFRSELVTYSFTGLTADGGKFSAGGVEIESSEFDFTGAVIKNCEFDFSYFDGAGLNFWFHETVLDYVDFDFHRFDVSKLRIDFTNSSYGEGDFYISDSEMRDAYLIFDFSEVGFGALTIENCRINGVTSFSHDLNEQWDKALSLVGCSIDGPLSFSMVFFSGVPDLTLTRISNHITFDEVFYTLNREGGIFKKVIVDSDDIVRLQRLKELASANGDHSHALKFHADELRASRWIDKNPFLSVLDCVFSMLSNYGQSIRRPLTFYALSVLLFSFILIPLVNACFSFSSWFKLLVLSASNSFPLLASSKDIKKYLLEYFSLSSDNVFSVLSLMSIQGVVSFVLLFLIGLGIRNHFRI